MRIRKRFSLHLSDPQLNSPVGVQQLKREINPYQENTKNQFLPSTNNIKSSMIRPVKSSDEFLLSDLPNLTLPQPSGQPANVTKGKSSSWVLFGGNSNQDTVKEKDVELADEDEKWREKIKSFSSNDNDNKKKENFLTPQLAGCLLLQLSSSSSYLDERWREGDKEIPLKRKRDHSDHNTSFNNIEEGKMMKSKTNKKCPKENDHNGLTHEEGFDESSTTSSSSNKVGEKKNKRGNVILEGSRCSRVNGRGWRCCQQTLVGYSLCEHHLGKGRLRSMRSVRNATKKKKEEVEKEEKVSLPNDNVEDQDHELKEKSIVVKKKKMKKFGMVKARSLSSLLGQTDNAVVAVKEIDDDSFLQPM